jgi:hypothetical protein
MQGGTEYQTVLQKLMWRWENTKPSDLANWLIQHGVAKDRTLAIEVPDAPRETAPHMPLPLLERWHRTRLARHGLISTLPPLGMSGPLLEKWHRTRDLLDRSM